MVSGWSKGSESGREHYVTYLNQCDAVEQLALFSFSSDARWSRSLPLDDRPLDDFSTLTCPHLGRSSCRASFSFATFIQMSR